MARRLVGIPRLTLVINSLPVAQRWHEAAGSSPLVGPVTVAALRDLHAARVGRLVVAPTSARALPELGGVS